MNFIFVIMNKIFCLLLALFFGYGIIAQPIDKESIHSNMKKVADWQIAHFTESYSRPAPHHPADWTNAALYVGMVKWAEMANDDSYFGWLNKIGEQQNWKLHKRMYHADDHAVGQMYLALYEKYKKQEMLDGTSARFDAIIAKPATSTFQWSSPDVLDRWSWCDALFMAPPVWARLSRITGEKKYSDFMMKEYKASYDFLYDKKENLFYRDERFLDSLDGGKKIFWSRGNGWVFAGLALLMEEYQSDSPEYKYFLSIYKKMAKNLLKLQTPQGHWAMNLLMQEKYPTPETSGTGFFTYGFAWGINHGILSAKKYKPAVEKGWNAMVSHITPDGMLGYVQPIGAAPGDAWPDKTEVYGAGAFLAAGSEVYKMENK